MAPRSPADLAQYRPLGTDRGLGGAELVSDLTLEPFSSAGHEAALNLLGKACRAMHGGAEDRADALIARAVSLPFDEYGEVDPAAAAAETLLFDLIDDTLHACDADDDRWLDAALDLLANTPGPAQGVLCDALVDIDGGHDLGARRRGLLRAAVATVPDGPDPSELPMPPEQLRAYVLAIVCLCTAYQRATSHPGPN